MYMGIYTKNGLTVEIPYFRNSLWFALALIYYHYGNTRMPHVGGQ